MRYSINQNQNLESEKHGAARGRHAVGGASAAYAEGSGATRGETFCGGGTPGRVMDAGASERSGMHACMMNGGGERRNDTNETRRDRGDSL